MRIKTALFCCVALTATAATVSAQPVTVTLDPTVIGPRARVGIGINGGTSWYNFVGANMVDDPSFEGPPNDEGFARAGWPWFTDGGVTGAIDTTEAQSGAQCQRVTVTAPPAAIGQGRVDLPQLPHLYHARVGQTYRIRVRVRSDTAGARIRLGVVNDGWSMNLGDELPVTTEWAVYEWDYSPATDHLLRGFAIGFEDSATYWLDDMVAWNVDDMDEATGLSATFVERLRELRPDTLRIGGLGVNGIPLESYLRNWWDLDYGPPALQPDFDINTFLRLCREVGAQPFITVPPAFSDDTSWEIGDLTDHVIANVFVDHGNFVDYLGGDDTTTYGARRQADGFDRWDLEFDTIYFELGNELWGTPDDHWDMDVNGDESQEAQMVNYTTYCERRMTEMLGRPGWRENMEVGFAGRSPTTWIGAWPGSYDHTLVPVIGSMTDFSTIDLYYGAGAADDSDEEIFGALFANAVIHEREIADMRSAFAAANGGVAFDTAVYEGNATWGGYEDDLSSPSPLYFKSVSLGAAVSLVDVYSASNRGGVTVNNHFHYGGNVWGATGPYPEVIRKPAFHAVRLLTRYTDGDLVTCTVDGSGTWDDALTSETSVPFVACYPYRAGEFWSILLVNRHRTDAQEVRIAHRLAPYRRVSLTGADINANNETAETISLQVEELANELVDEFTETVPPFSAVAILASETGEIPADGDGDVDGDVDGDADGDSDTDGDGDADGDGDGDGDDGCSCTAAASGNRGVADLIRGLINNL